MPELRARSRTPSTSRSGGASPEKTNSPRKGAPESKGCCFNLFNCSKWSQQRKQQATAVGWFLLAVLVVAGGTCTVHHRCAWKVNATTVGERIAFTLRCLVFSAATLAGSIKFVMFKRFSTGGINGSSNSQIDLANRLVQNSLEQFVLHSALLLAVSTYLNADQLKFIGLFVGYFVVGRVLFFLGYPSKRCFGFTLGWIPNALSFWALVYFIYTRGIAAF